MARNEILITHNGETMNITQWAKRVGMSTQAITYRLNAGWPVEEALSPSRKGRGPSAYCDGTTFERQRVLSEFDVLIRSIDRALLRFKTQIDQLFPDDTPGVVKSPSKNTKDRRPRVPPESA